MPIDPTSTQSDDTEVQPDLSYAPIDDPSAVQDQVAGAEAGVQQVESEGPSTLPLATAAAPESTLGASTVPLPGLGGPPSPPLEVGTMLGGRYEVMLVAGGLRNTNIYRVLDQQGYRRCWACGSSSSAPGDMYCVECGAQLTGRYYRVQEFSAPVEAALDEGPGTTDDLQEVAEPSEPAEAAEPGAVEDAPIPPRVAIPVPEPILANRVPGVVHAFDAISAPELGRVYVVWEEAYGRTLSAWLPEAGNDVFSMIQQTGHSGQLSTEEPSDEQSLSWMAQAAGLLARLHAEGIVGCNVDLSNLLVQIGDRLLLIDPAGCGLDNADTAAAQTSDVRALATELERWFMAVRRDTGALPTPEDNTGHLSLTLEGGQMVVASDVTGPFANLLNPAVALAKAREGSFPTAQAFAKVLQEIYEASMPLQNLLLWSGRATDVGQVRNINEDSLLTLEAAVFEHEGGLPVGLYVVADGMGGHQSGEVASSISVRTIGAVVNSSLIGPLLAGDPVACDPKACTALLRQAVMEANRRISELARERHSDLGTTTVATIMVGNQVCVANVGDSRAYLWQDGQVTPITRDHSLVAQLVAAGQIKPDDIYTHPRRNEIYRALGESRLIAADVDIFTRKLQPGEGLLICSDGLWDFVRDPVIATAINDNENPQAVCDALIALANKAGGEDNISAIFVRVVSTKRSGE